MQGGIAPFTSQNPEAWENDYQWAELDFPDAASLNQLLEQLSQPMNLDLQATNPAIAKAILAIAQYCREGVNTAVMQVEVPLNEWATTARGKNGKPLLDPKVYARMKNMAKVFEDGGGYEPGNADAGWKALLSHRPPLITQGFYDKQVTQNGNLVPFKLSHPDLRPLSSYEPEGMGPSKTPVEPQTLVGILTALFQINFPRQDIARGYAETIKAGVESAGPLGANLLAGFKKDLKLKPSDPAEKVYGMMGAVMAAKMQAGILMDPDVRKAVEGAGRFEFMDAASKKVFNRAYADVLKVVGNPKLSQEALMSALGGLNNQYRNHEMTYEFPQANGSKKKKTLDQWLSVPPAYEIASSKPGYGPDGAGAGFTYNPGYKPIAHHLPWRFLNPKSGD